MGYNICSLNVLRSVRDGAEDGGKDREFYAFINDLIKNEGIDIFAFQEVKNLYFIERVRGKLPAWWKGKYLFGSELSFIWNSNRVEECSRRHEPIIFKDYSSKTRLVREPAYGRFKPVDFKLNIEFRLINIHIIHGGDSPPSIAARKIECDLAKGVIYQTIDKPPRGKDGSFNSIFTVVLGDYNLDCDTCNTYGPPNIRTFQEEKTTLRQPLLPEYNNSELGYSNSFDHFSYDTKYSSVPRNEPSSINAVRDYFQGDFARYRSEVSNHVPVKLELL